MRKNRAWIHKALGRNYFSDVQYILRRKFTEFQPSGQKSMQWYRRIRFMKSVRNAETNVNFSVTNKCGHPSSKTESHLKILRSAEKYGKEKDKLSV